MSRLVVLPWKKSVEISYKSIKARFFRSLVTTVTLVLAVSFLAFSQITLNIADQILTTGDPGHCQTLIQCGYDIRPGDTSLAASPKQRWIIVLSLLVCVVGIVNAQLMSVTERFREIGTMKCLGALDSFIVRIFILEAAMEGFSGSLAGALLGGMTAFLATLFRFGSDTFSFLPWQAITSSIFISVLTGIGLSLFGVLYPAIMAARMQPVDAMRVEQ